MRTNKEQFRDVFVVRFRQEAIKDGDRALSDVSEM